MNMPTPNAGIRKSNPLVFWLRVIVAIAVVAGATWGLVYWLKKPDLCQILHVRFHCPPIYPG